MKNAYFTALLLATTGLLSACGAYDDGSDKKNSHKGAFSLGVTDAPVQEAEKVMITFKGVELSKSNGKITTLELSTPRQINLLAVNGVNSAQLFNNKLVDAGFYTGIRLLVDATESYIQVNGVPHELTIPSADQSGLKLNRNFSVGASSATDFTIDFNLQKSIHKAGSKYLLRPTLRIVNNQQAAAIRGTVTAAKINDINCINNGSNNDIGNLVYLFEGKNITPNDITGAASDAITTANVNWDDTNNRYEYVIGFVAPGEYTVAFSCDGNIDNADTNDAVLFSAQRNVTVLAGQDSNNINL